MKHVVIENPIINSPFREPNRHFRFTGEGITNEIIEVTGEKKKGKAAKVSTARTLWVPAGNSHGGFGRWDFLEIDDPWNAGTAIRTFLENRS